MACSGSSLWCVLISSTLEVPPGLSGLGSSVSPHRVSWTLCSAWIPSVSRQGGPWQRPCLGALPPQPVEVPEPPRSAGSGAQAWLLEGRGLSEERPEDTQDAGLSETLRPLASLESSREPSKLGSSGEESRGFCWRGRRCLDAGGCREGSSGLLLLRPTQFSLPSPTLALSPGAPMVPVLHAAPGPHLTLCPGSSCWVCVSVSQSGAGLRVPTTRLTMQAHRD